MATPPDSADRGCATEALVNETAQRLASLSLSLDAAETRMNVSLTRMNASLLALEQRESKANATAGELVQAVERLNQSLAGLTKQLEHTNQSLTSVTSDSAALKDAMLAQGARQKQVEGSALALEAQHTKLNESVSVNGAQLRALNTSVVATIFPSVLRVNATVESLQAQATILNGSMLALHAQHSKAAEAWSAAAMAQDVRHAKMNESVVALLAALAQSLSQYKNVSEQLVSLNASIPALHAQQIKGESLNATVESLNATVSAVDARLDAMNESVRTLDAQCQAFNASMLSLERGQKTDDEASSRYAKLNQSVAALQREVESVTISQSMLKIEVNVVNQSVMDTLEKQQRLLKESLVAVNDSVGAVNRSLNARISGILPGFSFLDRQVILSFIAPTYLRASTKRRGQSR